VTRDAELGAEGFEGEARVVGDGGAEFGLVASGERHPTVDGRAGVDLAGGLEAADELSHPFGAGGVLAAEFGEGPTGLEVREDTGTQVGGEGTHGRLQIAGSRSMTRLNPQRKTENQNDLTDRVSAGGRKEGS